MRSPDDHELDADSGGAPAADVDDRPLWAYVALPFVSVSVVAIFQLRPGGMYLLTLFGITVALVITDLIRNPTIEAGANTKRAGFVLAGVLFAPLYIFLRQRSLCASLWPIAAGVLVAVGAGALLAWQGLATPIDGALLEDELERWAAETLEVSVAAECPDTVPVRPGHAFECELRGTVDLVAEVEVVDRSGHVQWVTRPASIDA